MNGRRTPTAKKRLAAAMPKRPVFVSRAMIDQVIRLALSAGGVALHAARVGSGAPLAPFERSRRQPPFRPIGPGLDDVPAPLEFLDGRRRKALLDHQHTRARRSRPE